MRCGDVCKRRCEIELLVAVLIVLVLCFGFGGFYVGRPGYVGPGGGLSTLLYILAVIILIVLVLRVLGIAV
jgi:multisubunit Na+/H+ antiporter MnhB subunit